MAGTSPSAQCQGNPGRNVVIATLLVLSWQAAFAAPVVRSAPLSPHENSLTARKLLEWAMEHSFPTNTTATLSSETEFYQTVCPMFVNYTRFNLTLGYMSENSTNHVKLSLITFLLKKSMELTCENFKSNCSSKECSKLKCTTGSIANHCLHAPAQGFLESVQIPTRQQLRLVQSWIREHMAESDLDTRLLHSLKTVLSEEAFLRCTGCAAEHIVCIHDLGL